MQKINKHWTVRELYYWFFLVFSVATVVWFATSNETVTKDVFWHLEMGEDMLERHIFPRFDAYSFTWLGKEIASFPYLFEILIYWLTDTFGYETGTHIYLFGVFVLVLVLLFFYIRQVNASLVTGCLLVVGIGFFFSLRILLRPELVSYVFIVLSFIQYKRTLDNFGWQNTTSNFLIIVAWSNYHNSIFGYVIFAGLYFDLGVRAILARSGFGTWIILVISGMLLLLAGFLNPFFKNPLISTFIFDDRWRQGISEYVNFFFVIPDYRFRGILLIVALISMLYALKARFYGYLLILFFLILNAILVSRLLASTGIITMLVLADMVSSQSGLYQKGSTFSKLDRALPPVLFAIFAFFCGLTFWEKQPAPVGTNPVKLVDYFETKNYSGNVFNDYAAGGYLIYRLNPDVKVYIDGRTEILYDYPFFEHYLSLFSDTEKFRKEVFDRNIDYLVLANKSIPNNQLAYKTGLFELDFVDEQFSLYVREKGNFPVSGFYYLAPYCWNNDDLLEIKREYAVSQDLESLSSLFLDFQKRVLDYEKADKSEFIRNLFGGEVVSNASIRFMLYEALRMAEYDYVLEYFYSTPNRENKDYLATAIALFHLDEYEKAEELLEYSDKAKLLDVDDVDRLVFYMLLEKLNGKIELTRFPEGTLKDLKAYLDERKIDPNDFKLDHSVFCNLKLLGYESQKN